jgi:hypothetical protein
MKRSAMKIDRAPSEQGDIPDLPGISIKARVVQSAGVPMQCCHVWRPAPTAAVVIEVLPTSAWPAALIRARISTSRDRRRLAHIAA